MPEKQEDKQISTLHEDITKLMKVAGVDKPTQSQVLQVESKLFDEVGCSNEAEYRLVRAIQEDLKDNAKDNPGSVKMSLRRDLADFYKEHDMTAKEVQLREHIVAVDKLLGKQPDGKYKNVDKETQKALNAFTTLATTVDLLSLSDAYVRAGQVSKAEQALKEHIPEVEKLLSLDPQVIESAGLKKDTVKTAVIAEHRTLGHIYLEQGKMREFVSELSKAERLEEK